VPTEELSYHSLIEFGNRMMTGVVGIVALVLFVLVWRIRRERRDLFVLAFIVGAGVVAQAIVGGITVWTGLNPFIVGFHYVSSLLLVCVCAAFIVRMDATPGPRELAVPGWYAGLTHATTGVLALTIVFGILTTGAGPHSGDAAAGRNGFEAELLEHVHAWPGYALLALTVALLIGAWRLRLPTLRWTVVLLAAELVQIAVGLYQARNGLPPLAVGVHMVLAALTAATMTVVVLRLKRPVPADRPVEASVGA
jgi:cytochrome c oxidase assembly protein subunit 15